MLTELEAEDLQEAEGGPCPAVGDQSNPEEPLLRWAVVVRPLLRVRSKQSVPNLHWCSSFLLAPIWERLADKHALLILFGGWRCRPPTTTSLQSCLCISRPSLLIHIHIHGHLCARTQGKSCESSDPSPDCHAAAMWRPCNPPCAHLWDALKAPCAPRVICLVPPSEADELTASDVLHLCMHAGSGQTRRPRHAWGRTAPRAVRSPSRSRAR
jgi:hypothetical protein